MYGKNSVFRLIVCIVFMSVMLTGCEAVNSFTTTLNGCTSCLTLPLNLLGTCGSWGSSLLIFAVILAFLGMGLTMARKSIIKSNAKVQQYQAKQNAKLQHLNSTSVSPTKPTQEEINDKAKMRKFEE